MARILVTDGEQRAALAVVRSLGRAGHAVDVVSARARCLAGASRYCAGCSVVPDPLSDPPGFAEAVRERATGHDLLLPLSEAAVLASLPARASLPPVPYPSEATFRAIHDKAGLAEVAARCGIAVPRQIVVDAAGAESPAVWPDVRGPVVLKPARSVVSAAGGASKHAVAWAADGAELERRLRELPATAFPVLVQERVVGPGVGVFLLRWGGQVRASFGHERLREKPPSGGVSVLRTAVPVPDELAARCVALLEAFEWEGVAMVELKVDARSGTPYIMEVNGRFWGSLQLAIDAGVDFPALLVHYALGGAPVAAPAPRLGTTTRWLWGDVDHLLAVLRRRGLPPGDGASAWGRGAAAARFLAGFRPGIRTEVWRWLDPLPFVRESLDWFGALGR